MDVEHAIRSRRTHKAFAPDPVPPQLLDELLELARWAPNHHLTNPWRFRVLGPGSLAALKEAAGPEAAGKLDRAPTLVAATAVRSEDPDAGRGGPLRDCVRHLRGAARRPRSRACRLLAHAGSAAHRAGPSRPGDRADERFVALIHLGWPRQEKEPPERAPQSAVVSYLD